MANRVLLDTGVLVALANQGDPAHEKSADALSRVHGQVYSTEGVLVEAAYLLRRDPRAQAAAVGLAIQLGTVFVPPNVKRFDRIIQLMERYRDVPMDLVGATLVPIGGRARDRRSADTRSPRIPDIPAPRRQTLPDPPGVARDRPDPCSRHPRARGTDGFSGGVLADGAGGPGSDHGGMREPPEDNGRTAARGKSSSHRGSSNAHP